MRTVSVFLAGLIVIATGCTTNYAVRVPTGRDTGVDYLTGPSLRHSGRKYEVVGHVHAERWSPTMYWSSAGGNNQLSQVVLTDLQKKAQEMGADAVVDVLPKAENHYEFAIVLFFVPFIFCHEEVHAGATAIKYLD